MAAPSSRYEFQTGLVEATKQRWRYKWSHREEWARSRACDSPERLLANLSEKIAFWRFNHPAGRWRSIFWRPETL